MRYEMFVLWKKQNHDYPARLNKSHDFNLLRGEQHFVLFEVKKRCKSKNDLHLFPFCCLIEGSKRQMMIWRESLDNDAGSIRVKLFSVSSGRIFYSKKGLPTRTSHCFAQLCSPIPTGALCVFFN